MASSNETENNEILAELIKTHREGTRKFITKKIANFKKKISDIRTKVNEINKKNPTTNSREYIEKYKLLVRFGGLNENLKKFKKLLKLLESQVQVEEEDFEVGNLLSNNNNNRPKNNFPRTEEELGAPTEPSPTPEPSPPPEPSPTPEPTPPPPEPSPTPTTKLVEFLIERVRDSKTIEGLYAGFI